MNCSSIREQRHMILSSGVEGARTYEMVTTSQGQTVKIIFEPNKTILEGMKMLAPRKVFI